MMRLRNDERNVKPLPVTVARVTDDRRQRLAAAILTTPTRIVNPAFIAYHRQQLDNARRFLAENNVQAIDARGMHRVRTEVVSPVRAAIRAGTYDDAGPNLDAAIVAMLPDVVADDLPDPVPNDDGRARDNFAEPNADRRDWPDDYESENDANGNG